MNKILNLYVAIVNLTICTASIAQSFSPEDVANLYFNTLKTQGFTATGNLIHPDALEEFRGLILPVFESGEQVGVQNW